MNAISVEISKEMSFSGSTQPSLLNKLLTYPREMHAISTSAHLYHAGSLLPIIGPMLPSTFDKGWLKRKL